MGINKHMRILAIVGTPTKDQGYTMRSVVALERSLRQIADIEFEYLFLEDINLPRCQGYLTCIKFGEQRCPFNTEVSALVSAMEAADAVVFASPVHCFNVSTLMKNFLDLLVYQMHRPSLFGKKAIVVTTAAGAGQKSVLKYLRKTVANWGFHVVGQLGTHAGLFEEPKYQAKLAGATQKLALRLATEIESRVTPKPGITELINFRVWRAVVTRTEHDSPYDWAHWRESGWLDQDYYFPVRVNFFANGIAIFIEKMIDRAIRKVSVGPLV